MATANTIISQIEASLEQLTSLEMTIANFFLRGEANLEDLSSATVSQTLHISPAALTRFAQKCGFKGYREFIFEYANSQAQRQKHVKHMQKDLTKQVMFDYADIVEQTNAQIDEEKLERVAQMLDQASRVYFYGLGSSGLVAKETKLRFMRLGLVCDAVTDRENMIWTNSILDESCLVFALSLTGQTQSILDSLETASKKGAKTVLISTQAPEGYRFDEHVTVAAVHHLNYGNRISPQFPLLMIIDILYAYYLAIDKTTKETIFKDTIID